MYFQKPVSVGDDLLESMQYRTFPFEGARAITPRQNSFMPGGVISVHAIPSVLRKMPPGNVPETLALVDSEA